MTSKAIEGHKSSSNFSVSPTLLLLDAYLSKLCGFHSPSCSLFPSLSLTLSLSTPLLLYAKVIYEQRNVFRYCSNFLCHTVLCKVILGIRLSCKAFWWHFLVRVLFMLYFAVWENLWGIEGEIFSSSSPSIFLALLSIFLFCVSNGHFCPCS